MVRLTWRSRIYSWSMVEIVDPSTITLAMIEAQCLALHLDCEIG